MLSIKPLVDLSSGVTEEAGKARTRKKALAWLAEKVLEQPKLHELWVMHSQAPDIDEFLDLLAGTYQRDEISVGIIGATIGTHAGPRVMGVAFQVPA
jgi:fatty acid-binding protein DegV